ncbi:MAG TPA: hypothetical protein VGC29_00475 [Flavisolibacter sp.]
MKKLFIIALLSCLISCDPEEIVQQQQENLVIQAITTGHWKVTSFVKGGTDVTLDFAPYKFQFKTNYTVDAINNGTVEKTGSWNADANAQTITSNFSNASNPLVLLNGVFNIESTTWTSVNASQTVNGELRTLRLEKL